MSDQMGKASLRAARPEGCCRAAVDSEGFAHDHADWHAEVESLRTQLAEVTRERDEARQDLAEAVAVNATVIAESDRRKAERDEARFQRDQECHGRKINEFGLLAKLRDAQAERAAAEARLASALKVVEAAKAYAAAWRALDRYVGDDLVSVADPMYRAREALVSAVDAWQPARPGDTPGKVVPGEGDQPPLVLGEHITIGQDHTDDPDSYRATCGYDGCCTWTTDGPEPTVENAGHQHLAERHQQQDGADGY